MNKQLLQNTMTQRLSQKSDEEILFSIKVDRFLRGAVNWFLTNQRLFTLDKDKMEEKSLFFPEEQVVTYETGEKPFTGNVHLLTNQRVVVLDVGAKDCLLESIPLSQIAKLDITSLSEKWSRSFVFGLRFLLENDQVIEILHGRMTTDGIHEQPGKPTAA